MQVRPPPHHIYALLCHIMCFSKSETVWGRRCYGFQFLPTSSYNQAAAQGNTVPSVGSPFTNLQGVLPNVYFYSPTVDVTKTSTYMCAIRASVPRRGAPCNSLTAPTPSATSVWLLTPCAWVTGCHRYRKLPLPPPAPNAHSLALQVRIIDVRFLPRPINIGPTIAVEKPAWRIQGGFEFVLAGITITDSDASDDGGLVTCKLTATRGWCVCCGVGGGGGGGSPVRSAGGHCPMRCR